MTPFWNWFWHSIAFILALLIGLPSFMIRRIVQRLSLHRPLAPGEIREVRWRGQPLSAEDARQVVGWFNQSAFLLRQRAAPPCGDDGLVFTLASGRGEIRVCAGERECEVVRLHGKRQAAYQVRSEPLYRWLSERAGGGRSTAGRGPEAAAAPGPGCTAGAADVAATGAQAGTAGPAVAKGAVGTEAVRKGEASR
ncbi:MAG: YfmQ family protein [Alicyclobacillus sp.]|nr:YfmQ family protein [Alicyclobacillus sp.]